MQLNGCSWFLGMDSQTLGIKAQRQQLFSRGLICSSKDFYLLMVLLCDVFILVTCKQHSVNEGQNQFEFEACRSNEVSFGTSSPDICDDYGTCSELVSKHSVQQHSPENICPSSNLFCFPSTLTGLSEIDVESESSDTSVGSEPKLMRSNLTWSRRHSTFRLLDRRLISCSLYQQDDFHEYLPSDGNTKHSKESDISSCIIPLVNDKTRVKKSGQHTKSVTSGFLDGLSAPTVEIRPNLMDWGHKNIYNPSLAFLTVKNVDSSNVLTVYDFYSSNSQFYACNFSETILAPGEVASICIVFFPTNLSLSSAQLVLQANFGGFLIQVKGFAIESPYLIKPISGLDVSSNGKWKKNVSLFNPFNDALHVEEVTAWLTTSSGNTSLSSRAKCVTETTEVSRKYSALNAEDWLNGPEIFMKPHENWEVGPQKTGTVIELDISYTFEGIFFGVLCLKLSRSSNNKVDTVMVPFEAELHPRLSSDTNSVSAYLDVLVPYDTSGSLVVALLVRNDSPNVISVIKVVGESVHAFQIKYVEGLLLYPHTSTQVAILSYGHEESSEVFLNCKLLVLINATRNSQIEIPCKDMIGFCSGSQLHSSVGHREGFCNVDHINGRQKSFGGQAVDTREADELVLKSWKSQASANIMTVLETNELLFQVIHVGNYSSQWITVNNPSPKPVVMQLILNSGEVIENCKKPELVLQPSTSSTLMGNKSIAPTRYGFSIAKNALSEVFLHPYESAFLGPILFQPSNRCEWISSALIRNNLSGVEWLSLRGFGGSLSIGLLEGSNPVQNLQFKLNLPTQLNISFSKGGKIPPCSEPLAKEVYAKNMGDLPVEVIRIKVSGSECGLDGFRVHDCKGFTLQPGESVKLLISYLCDFSVDTIQRDLELVLATSILVIPMKASLPIYALNFCKRLMFWSRLKEAAFMLVFAASLLYLLVCLLLPRTITILKSGKTPFSTAIRSLDSLQMHFNLKMSGFVGTIGEEEELLLESATRSSDGKQTSSLLDSQPETRSMSNTLSKSSSVEDSDIQNVSDSQNLSVKVKKEKGKRRRKKKHSGAGVMFDVSSSQSGNSTPSSPLSPVTSTIRRPWPISSGMERSIEARNPFTHAPVQQRNKVKCSEPLSNVSILADEATSRRDYHNRGSSANEKANLTRKIAGRAVLLPSATFPTSGRASPAWTCNSPVLASTSPIAPHARAPGTKIHVQKTGEGGKIVGFEEKFTYDIWGDHLFGRSLIHKSKEISSNNSHSFFVTGPQSLGESSLLKSVSPNMEGNNINNNN